MTFFPDPSTFLTIGGLNLRWYTVTLLAGVIAAYFLVSSHMKDHGYTIDTTDEIMVMCMIGGAVFGRAFWVVENLSDYMKYVPYIFAVGDGGFDILGVMFGVIVMMFLYTQVRHMSILRTLDIVLPATLLFGIITRVGRAYEQPAIWILSGIDMIGFMLLNYYFRPYKPGRRRGDLTAMTLMWAGLTRILAIVFGWDSHASNSLFITIGVELVGVVLYYIVHRRKPTMPIILFDLDGTLMDSHQMVIQCFSYLFKKYGDIRDFTAEKQQEVFGPPLREEMIKLFPDQDPDQMVAEYSEYQSTFSWSDEVSLFPHVKETLDVLWTEGYMLGVVSSRMPYDIVLRDMAQTAGTFPLLRNDPGTRYIPVCQTGTGRHSLCRQAAQARPRLLHLCRRQCFRCAGSQSSRRLCRCVSFRSVPEGSDRKGTAELHDGRYERASRPSGREP